jgi:hypothetical protein
MSVLVNFPMRDQLTEATQDGRPSENAGMNCVATSSADAATWLTGVWHSGDALKDLVYGERYTGGTAAARYVNGLAEWGVKIWSESASSQAGLIPLIRANIRAGHPTLITMPSAWGSPPRDDMHPGASHVGAVYQIDDSDAGAMTVMNPWRGFAHRRTIREWMRELCYRQIWPMARLDGSSSMTGATGVVTLPSNAHAANGRITFDGTDKVMVKGFAADVVSGRLRLLPGEYPLENEHGDASQTQQLTTHGLYIWTPKTGTYQAPIGSLFGALLGERDTLKGQLATVTGQVSSLQAQIAADQAQVSADSAAMAAARKFYSMLKAS